MFSTRNQIIYLIAQGSIPVDKIKDTLNISAVHPDGKSWVNFIDLLLLWLGALALAFSVLFFIAYNWTDIGRYAKFGLVELLIILAIFVYWKMNEHKVIGKVSLLMASIFLGVLLALYGQTYQTGADPWQLFFYWALLILPWVIIARFPAMWMVWLVLINISIILYQDSFRNIFWTVFDFEMGLYWLIFIFNTIALLSWEYLTKTYHWLSERWVPRLIAVTAGVPITWLVLYSIFESRHNAIISVLIWVTWLVVLYFVYRKKKRDLFMLAGCCLTSIIIVVAFLSKLLLTNNPVISFLFLALVIVSLGTGSAIWLRRIHREWQS